MNPNPPNKPPIMHKAMPFHAKKPKYTKPIKPRTEMDKFQLLESMKVDNVTNTIEYLLSRNFMEDGVPDHTFSLLENFHPKNIPSYTTRNCPALGICDELQGFYKYRDKKTPTCLIWAPNGKRAVVGNSKGELSLIDGSVFTLESSLQVQQRGKSLRAITTTKNNKYTLAGDEEGNIKYLDKNYKEIKEVRSSETDQDAIKEISMAPTDLRFVVASDSKNLRIWDFEKGKIEKELIGHANDIHCVKWHPHQGLIVSGSKDSTIKFWDPNSGEELASLITHTNAISSVQWNQNGNWLLSCSRDQSVRMYDLRMLKEIQSFTGFNSEVEDLVWNPFHERLFVAGTKDGTLSFWLALENEALSTVTLAHSYEKKETDITGVKPYHLLKKEPPKGVKITGLAWNPTGDQLVTAGTDNSIKFWGRSKNIAQGFEQINIPSNKADSMDITSSDVLDTNPKH